MILTVKSTLCPLRVLLAVFVCAQASSQSVLYTWDGDWHFDDFGRSVSGAGDVNGDGFDDLIVGAPGDDNNGSNSGSVWVFHGLMGGNYFTRYGDSAGDNFGRSVSGAGDVNGDGFDDLIVGAHDDDNNGSNSGSATVFAVTGVGVIVLYTFDGDSAGNEFGWSVSGAGDVNADGFDDLIVGAPKDDNNGTWSGSARVLSGANGSILYTFDGDSSGDNFGFSVSGAGDMNGDGFADVIVGARFDDNNGSNSGSARVFSGVNGNILYTWDGDSADYWFGQSVSGAGDVNGDGFDDLVVGAIGDNNGTGAGSVWVFSGVDGSVLYTLYGDSALDKLGWSVSGAGDVNGDGFDDLIAGAPVDDNNGPSSGSARVFSGVDGSVLYTFDGDSAGVGFGSSVSGAGDVNGDGLDDLIVGAPFYGLYNSGRARVFASKGELGASYCGPAVPNSTGQPGVVRAFGLVDVNENELFLTADQLPNGEFGYFLVSRTQGTFVPPGSLGFICIVGDIGRFNQAPNVIQGPTDTIQVDLNSLPTNAPGSQQAMPGETLNFQCWYRDVGNTNNFTDAVSILFQ